MPKPNHYHKYGDLQPWDVYDRWNLTPFAARILNYIVSWRDRGGVWDLKQAREYLDKWIAIEEQKLKDQ